MKIRIHSADLQRMMKIAGACVNPRLPTTSAIEIIHDNNILSIRANDGQFGVVASTPLMGGEGESFCVDGTMFGKAVGMCSGETVINVEDKECKVWFGTGRTRMPVIKAKIPAFDFMTGGNTVVMRSKAFRRMLESVDYAIATDQSRKILTGALVECDGKEMRMVALDGFRMATDTAKIVNGTAPKMIIPGAFLKMVGRGLTDDGYVKMTTDGSRLTLSADGLMLSCGLLEGEFPDYHRLLPETFKTEALTETANMLAAVKSGSIINGKQKLVKLLVRNDKIEVRNNAEAADYYAEVDCMMTGEWLQIAFNEQYLIEALRAVDTEKIVMQMNSSVSPVVIRNDDDKGKWIHLLLPVRTAG